MDIFVYKSTSSESDRFQKGTQPSQRWEDKLNQPQSGRRGQKQINKITHRISKDDSCHRL